MSAIQRKSVIVGASALAATVRGEGEAVTLLHGFSQIAASWDEMLSLLPAGYRYVVPDLPGHGGSLAAPCRMTLAAAALKELWDGLGIRRSHLVGYSLGGRFALYFASLNPARVLSLVSLSASAGIEDPNLRRGRRQADRELGARIEREGLDWFIPYWGGLAMFKNLALRGGGFAASSEGWRRQNTPSGLRASLAGMGQGSVAPFWDRLQRIQVPATLIAGELDLKYREHALRLASRIPKARAAILPDTGHACHLERPHEVAAIIQQHLAHVRTK